MTIRVKYTSIDRCRVSRKFKTLVGAQKFAQDYVGAHPELGAGYAVSGDGIGKVTVEGATLRELFPEDAAQVASGEYDDEDAGQWQHNYNARRANPAPYDNTDECPF